MKVTRSFYIDRDLLDSLQKWAKSNAVTTNEALCVLLSKGLGLEKTIRDEDSELDKLKMLVFKIIDSLEENNIIKISTKGLR